MGTNREQDILEESFLKDGVIPAARWGQTVLEGLSDSLLCPSIRSSHGMESATHSTQAEMDGLG
jgi:hypothetical protein